MDNQKKKFAKKTQGKGRMIQNHLFDLNNSTYPFFTSDRILIHSSKKKLQQTKPHFSATSWKTLEVHPSQLNLIHFTYLSKKIMQLIKP